MRRRTEEAGSLDLLLDTVTNTFGGVFFVAVLVTMLLRVASPVPAVEDVNSNRQRRMDEHRIRAKTAELHSLELALSQQESTLDNLTASAGKHGYEELAELRTQFDRLAKERIDLQTRLDAHEDVLRQDRTNLRDLQSDISKELQRKVELEQLISDEQTARTRTVGLPTLRESDKFEFPVIVRYGRLYSAYVPDPVLMRRRNVEEFVVMGEDDGVTRITPKPYQGIRLDKSTQCEETVRERLNGIDKRRSYIAVGIWEDSFAEFAYLRRILVDAGFEYRIVPIPKGEMIWEGGSGDRFVQ